MRLSTQPARTARSSAAYRATCTSAIAAHITALTATTATFNPIALRPPATDDSYLHTQCRVSFLLSE